MKNNIISGGTALTTIATGLGNVTQMIPEGIGKLACVVGIVGTFVVIIVNLARLRKLDLEITKLKKDQEGN